MCLAKYKDELRSVVNDAASWSCPSCRGLCLCRSCTAAQAAAATDVLPSDHTRQLKEAALAELSLWPSATLIAMVHTMASGGLYSEKLRQPASIASAAEAAIAYAARGVGDASPSWTQRGLPVRQNKRRSSCVQAVRVDAVTAAAARSPPAQLRNTHERVFLPAALPLYHTAPTPYRHVSVAAYAEAMNLSSQSAVVGSTLAGFQRLSQSGDTME